MLTHAERPLSAFDAIFRRRSVRSYAPQTLDDSTIRFLLDAAVQAPTAMHAEPWTFVVIQNAATLERYSSLAKAALMHDAAVHADLHTGGDARARDDFAARLADPNFSIFYDARTLIVICAKPLGPFVVADCWLAAQTLMLAACALGLGTCCIGLAVPVLNTPEAKADLAIPADVTAIAPIILGVPAGSTPGVSRRDPEILSWRK